MIFLTILAVDWLECVMDGLTHYGMENDCTIAEVRQIIYCAFPSLLEQDPSDTQRVSVEIYLPNFRRVPLHDNMVLDAIASKYCPEQVGNVFQILLLGFHIANVVLGCQFRWMHASDVLHVVRVADLAVRRPVYTQYRTTS